MTFFALGTPDGKHLHVERCIIDTDLAELLAFIIRSGWLGVEDV